MIRNKSFSSENNLLYLIATPIGNLKEFSPRAIEVISQCDIVAAEDTRNAMDLLLKFNIKKSTYSLREHNEKEASLFLINKIKEGKKVCYMSDAGYPCISDPGNILVKECISNGIRVSTISGSSAGINALVASGLDTSHYLFYGFLSSKDKEAKDDLKDLMNFKNTIVFYEAPHRIERTLKILNEVLGNRRFVLARELTKLNEEYIYGSLDEIKDFDFSTIKGEMVIIVSGNSKQETINENEILERINYFKNLKISNKDIVDIIVFEYKVNKNYVKKLLNN